MVVILVLLIVVDWLLIQLLGRAKKPLSKPTTKIIARPKVIDMIREPFENSIPRTIFYNFIKKIVYAYKLKNIK